MRMRESAVALVLLIIVDALDGSNPNAADSRQGESREVEELVFPSTIGIVDRSALDRRWKRSAKALEQRCRCHDRDEYRELFELVHAVAPEHAVIALDREGTADHTGPEYHRLKCVIETAATEISTEVVHVQTLELYRQQRGEVGKIDLLVLPVDRHSSELIGSEAQKWLVAGFSNESFVWDVWRGSAIVLVGTNMQDGQDKSGGVAAGIEFAMRVSGTVIDPAESFDGWYVGCPDSPGCMGGGDATRWAGGSNNGVGEEEWRLIHTPTVGGVTTLLQLPHPAFAQPSHSGNALSSICWGCRRALQVRKSPTSYPWTGIVGGAQSRSPFNPGFTFSGMGFPAWIGWKWDVRTVFINLDGAHGASRRSKLEAQVASLRPMAPIQRFSALDGISAPQCRALATPDGETQNDYLDPSPRTICCLVSFPGCESSCPNFGRLR
jgi:hypothetical protein